MAKLHTLTETFDTFNASIWDRTSGTQIVFDGQLNFNTTTSAVYYVLTTDDLYDLSESHGFIELVNGGNQALESLEVYPLQLVLNSNNFVHWFLGGGNLIVNKRVGGTTTQLGSTLTYNNTTHKYLRIREASGTVYFDYSSDGENWTNHTSELVSSLFTITALEVDITVGTWQSETATSVVMDNFNIDPPPPLDPSAEQHSFRWRDDDGSETGASWLQPLNTNIAKGTETPTRVRVLVDTNGDYPSSNFRLEYRKKGSGDPWRKI